MPLSPLATSSARLTQPRPGLAAAPSPDVLVQILALDDARQPAARGQGVAARDIEQAAQFSSATARARFLAGRRLLRGCLGPVLGCPPEAVPIVVAKSGKPQLAGSALHFSFSRSFNICAVATSWDCPVGVDIEVVRAIPAPDDVVRHFFPEGAQAEYFEVSDAMRLKVFFDWWVRIEASVKTLGFGLSSAARIVESVPQRSYSVLHGLALAVAGLSGSDLSVEWRMGALPSQTEEPERRTMI